MNLDGSEYLAIIMADGVGPQAVDYHWRYSSIDSTAMTIIQYLFYRLNKMFWSDYIDGTLNQADLDGANRTIIVSSVTRPSESPYIQHNNLMRL